MFAISTSAPARAIEDGMMSTPADGRWTMSSASVAEPTTASYTDRSRPTRSTPNPLVALPWGSKSITRTRSPARARYVARLTTVVVLPTPPFWFAQAIVWRTQCPMRNAVTSVNSTIERGSFSLLQPAAWPAWCDWTAIMSDPALLAVGSSLLVARLPDDSSEAPRRVGCRPRSGDVARETSGRPPLGGSTGKGKRFTGHAE